MAVLVVIMSILALMLLRVPMYISFVLSSTIGIVFFVDVPFSTIVQTMFSALDKFALMAVPFFIFTAEIMSRGSMAQRLISWIFSFVGRVRGSAGITTVVSCEFFGAISGSSPATVAALGKVLYPRLRQEGYGEQFSAGLITAGGAIAMVIPPSIGMILYAISGNVSVGDLFIAGIIPGILLGVGYIVYILFHMHKHGIKQAQETKETGMWELTKGAVWTLGVPVIIIGGIYSGIFTATESAAVSAVYALFVSLVIYREIYLKEVLDISIASGILTAKIFILVASSSFFSYILSIEQVPQQLVGWVQDLHLSTFTLLLVINVILLIVGMFIDPNSAILVFTPLLLPLIEAVGVNPVHFGIIMTVNLAIGMYTPPFGLNIFVTSANFNLPVSRIIPGLLPFIKTSLLVLFIITLFPWFSLYLVQFVQ